MLQLHSIAIVELFALLLPCFRHVGGVFFCSSTQDSAHGQTASILELMSQTYHGLASVHTFTKFSLPRDISVRAVLVLRWLGSDVFRDQKRSVGARECVLRLIGRFVDVNPSPLLLQLGKYFPLGI